VLMGAGSARRLGKAARDELSVARAGKTFDVQIVGLLASERDATTDGVLVADISTAQERLGMLGRLSRIDLIIADDARVAAIQAKLPADTRLVDAHRRRGAAEGLSSAFQLNLTAMSLLALIVGAFLIYNAVTFSVLQRRPLLAKLRLLGVTRGGLFRAVMGESLAIASIGIAGGIALGSALGQLLVDPVRQTMTDHFRLLTAPAVVVPSASVVKAALLGILATSIASALPALEAARVSPTVALSHSSLEQQARRWLPALALCGAVLAATGLSATYWPSGSLPLAFTGLFIAICGFSLLIPGALLLATQILVPLLAAVAGSIGRIASRSVARTITRTGIAVAALAVAVSATIGVGLMIGGFRQTVAHWLDSTLRGDIYISAPATVASRPSEPFAPRLVEPLRQITGVKEVGTRRMLEVEATANAVELAVEELTSHSRESLALIDGDTPAAWRAFENGRAVFVSEPLAYHRSIELGDELELQTDRGPRTFRVDGIFSDYASTAGYVLMARPLYQRHWRDRRITSVSIYLDPAADSSRVLKRVRALTSRLAPQLLVRRQAEIRQLSLDIFDRTFAITEVLRLLVVLVALIGVLSAILALELERRRDHAVLRALGLTVRGLFGLITLETAIIGLAAGLLACPLGYALSHALSEVINKRSFGWTLQSFVSVEIFAQGLIVALVAALLAGIYPAWRIAHVSPATALEE
jgi:putative ABC transport system permease protein